MMSSFIRFNLVNLSQDINVWLDSIRFRWLNDLNGILAHTMAQCSIRYSCIRAIKDANSFNLSFWPQNNLVKRLYDFYHHSSTDRTQMRTKTETFNLKSVVWIFSTHFVSISFHLSELVPSQETYIAKKNSYAQFIRFLCKKSRKCE